MSERIIRKERPDALLPTLGGQTGLNMAVELANSGILDECEVEILGTKLKCNSNKQRIVIYSVHLMNELNEPVPDSEIIHNLDEAYKFVELKLVIQSLYVQLLHLEEQVVEFVIMKKN